MAVDLREPLGAHAAIDGHRRAPPPPVVWDVAPQWRHVLLEDGQMPLERWLADGRAQVIKHGAHRTVYRLSLPGRAFFLKHDHGGSWWRALKSLFRASAGRREYVRAIEVARRDVPTVRPVAVGEQRRGGVVTDSFLVTEAIEDAVTLGQYIERSVLTLPERASRRAWLTLADRLAELCAAAHRGGVDHDDLHRGNILVRSCAEGSAPELFLVDVPGVRLSGPMNWPRSRASLVMLHGDFIDTAPAKARWRFFRAYLRLRSDLSLEPPRVAAADIIRRTRHYVRHVSRGRDQRPLRNNREFYSMAIDQAVAHVVVGIDPAEVRRLLADPESPLRANADRPVKLSHTSLLVEANIFASDGPLAVAYKRTRPNGWWKWRFAWCRRRRGVRAWRMGHALAARGIRTARPVLAIVPQGWRSPYDAYVATQWIHAAENVHLYGWSLARRDVRERTRRARQAAVSMGRLVGRMHAWQISHGDLKGCNLLLAEQSDSVDAYLLDTDGVRVLRRLSHRRRVKDLARLAASASAHGWLTDTDRMRFFKAYARQLRPENVDLKRLWRDVGEGATAIIERLRKSGKPVL